jgi:hypothetical protein
MELVGVKMLVILGVWTEPNLLFEMNAVLHACCFIRVFVCTYFCVNIHVHTHTSVQMHTYIQGKSDGQGTYHTISELLPNFRTMTHVLSSHINVIFPPTSRSLKWMNQKYIKRSR